MNNIYFDSHEFAAHGDVKFIFASIVGAINKYTLKDLEKFYATLIEKKHSIIGLSLSQIEYIDSTGLGILANFQQKCKDLEVDLKLVAISPKILHLFEMLGMTSFFEIYESNADLVQKLRNTNKIAKDTKFYLRKMDELRQKNATKNTATRPNISQKKLPHMIIELPYNLHMKKVQEIIIQFTSNKNVKEIILSCDGCIIQPPCYHILEDTKNISFSITPIIHQSKTTLKIHLFSQKSCIYELPVETISTKYFFLPILIMLAFIYQYFFAFFIYSTAFSFFIFAVIWKFQKKSNIVKYLFKI